MKELDLQLEWIMNRELKGSALLEAALRQLDGALARCSGGSRAILALSARLGRLAEADFLGSLEARLRGVKRKTRGAGFEGDVRWVVGDSAATRVVLGGTKPTTYRGQAALVIDLGGNDLYEQAAVVRDESAAISIVLDLGLFGSGGRHGLLGMPRQTLPRSARGPGRRRR